MMRVLFDDGSSVALPQENDSLGYGCYVNGNVLILGDVEEGLHTVSQVSPQSAAPNEFAISPTRPALVQPSSSKKNKLANWVIPVVVTLAVLLSLVLVGYGIYWYEINKKYLGVCEKNPCQNGGTCINKLDEYACDCADYFSGEKCQFGLRLGGDTATSSLEGRVEMFSSLHQEWEVIHDYYFDDVDATVICKQSGLSGGTAIKHDYFGGSDDAPCRSSTIGCLGTEDYFQECNMKRNLIRDDNCNRNQAGVRCEP